MKSEAFSTHPNNKQENWISYRESKEFKNGITELENLENVTSQAKSLILAVALNLKKATEFDVPTELVDSGHIDRVLSDLGVYFSEDQVHRELFEKWQKENGYGSDDLVPYIAAATPDSLRESLERGHVDDSGDHSRFGQAMEFPDTAIKAWQRRVDTNEDTSLLPMGSHKLTEEESAFSFFRLSNQNWEKEVEWLEQIIAGVKKYSPEIYNQVLSGKS